MRIVKLSRRGADAVDSWDDGDPLDESLSHRRLARRLLDAGMVHPAVGRLSSQDLPGIPDRADLTVIVPVKDNPTGLDRCLAALVDYRVVVVDDGSDDAITHRRVAKRYGTVYLRRDENGGPGRARGTGLESVGTAFVAFVDSDVETPVGWFAGLATHFADPAVMAVAPRTRSRRGSGLLAVYEREHSPLDLGDAPGPVGVGRVVSYVPAAALVARTSAITSIGGFDPDLRWGEDVDLIWRLVEAGAVVRYEPAVQVVHDPRPDWSAWFSQRVRYGASAAPLGRRHGRKIAPVRCSRWSAGAWALVAAGHPVVGGAVAVGSTVALAKRLESLPHPRNEAVRLAGKGHLMAGLGLARANSRVWWPLALAIAVVRPRRGAAMLSLLLAPAVVDWAKGRRPAGALPSIALRTADDMAYGVGVWKGALAGLTISPLWPDFSDWPGRGAAVDEAGVNETAADETAVDRT